MLNKIKKLDTYLLLGIILTSVLLIIAIFGNVLAPYDKSDAAITMIEPDTQKIIAAPFPPSWSHWLGTDELGIDLVSKLFRGAKYTVLVVFVVGISRILLALPLGIIAGYWSKYLKRSFSFINRAWTSMPLFLFVYIIIEPIVVFEENKYFQIFLLWLILTLAGLPPIIESIRGHVEKIKGYEFMEGVRVLGAGNFYTIRKHILPHLKPNLVIMLSMEMAQILWLLGQLGVFHIFVGGTLAVYDFETGETLFYSQTDEWAGLLGYGRRYIFSAPWIPIAPTLAFVYGIFSFTFLAEGIRKKLSKNQMKYDF